MMARGAWRQRQSQKQETQRKFKDVGKLTGFTGLTGLDYRDLGGLSDWMSDSLDAGGLRETNTKIMCLFLVATGASCEANSASQPAQSMTLTFNSKFIRENCGTNELNLSYWSECK